MKPFSALLAFVTIFVGFSSFAADVVPDLTNKTLNFDIIVNLGPVNSDYGSKFLLISNESNLAAFVNCRSGDIITKNWAKIKITDRGYNSYSTLGSYYVGAEECAEFYSDAIRDHKHVSISFGPATYGVDSFPQKFYPATVSI